MLVLSRRLNERLVIPAFDTAIQVVAVQSHVVRLGIEAPPDVRVYREEIYPGKGSPRVTEAALEGRHAARDRLRNVNLGLAVLRGRLQGGSDTVAEEVLLRIEAEVAALASLLFAGDGWAEPPQLAGPAHA